MEAERTDQEVQRRQKLQTLRSQGIEPYQSRFDRTHSSAEAIGLFEQAEKSGGAETRTERVALAGRLVALRVMGKATFAHLQDFSGRIHLIANPDVMAVFLARSRLVEEARTFLRGRGFTEVETPVLQAMAGGAAARPFRTHHNALDMDLYLRIALELHLKRLIIGGFDRVY